MKKVLLTSVVAGIFLAGCGENLPSEITSHENFKSCQQVEKNLLTIQSSFEKDERETFYKKCNMKFDKDAFYKDIFDNNEKFTKIKAELTERYDSLEKLYIKYVSKAMIYNAETLDTDTSFLTK